MAAEDFSFPIITTPSSRFIDSPPLWRVSSPAATGRAKREEDDCFVQKRNSFSCVESQVMVAREDEEEKMDMLWEDFNEELCKRKCSRPDFDSSRDEMVELGCVRRAMTVSKSGGAMISADRRRPGMVVFVKVLKKLFLLHNSHSSLKKGTDAPFGRNDGNVECLSVLRKNGKVKKMMDFPSPGK